MTSGSATRPGPIFSTVRLGSLPDESSGELRFVQDRLALFSKVVFWIAFAFQLMGVVMHVFGIDRFFQPGRESQCASGLISLTLWLLLRRPKTFSPNALRGFDYLGTVGTCLCLVVMGHLYALSKPWGTFASTLGIVHVVMARAIIVPSTPKHTLRITVLCYLGLIVSQRILPALPGLPTGEAARWIELLGPITWTVAGTALASVASTVIYGLQEKVLEARQLGQYTLEEKLGAGGMGEVYRARHAMLRRPTAIKLLAGDVSEAQLQRFEREVQLTALLTHPNTISIYDYGRTPAGTFYYAMELVDGLTLEDLVERYGPQPPGRVLSILQQACGALREAHEAGLVHRDVKPANIMLCERGGLPDRVKVLDFGLVKQLEGEGKTLAQSNVNHIVGTPLYLAPEGVLSSSDVDCRSDLYALGAVGYFLLVGEPVFNGQTVIEVCVHHLHTEPVPVAERAAQAVPADLAQLLMRCLQKSPEARPQTADELLTELEGCLLVSPYTVSEARAFWASRRPTTEPPPAKPGAQTSLRIELLGRRSVAS